MISSNQSPPGADPAAQLRRPLTRALPRALGQILDNSDAAPWLRTLQAERLRDHILARIHRKATALDLGYFDSAGHHDELDCALGRSRHTPAALLESLGTVLQGGVTLGAVVGILAAYGTWLLLALLASAAQSWQRASVHKSTAAVTTLVDDL